MTKRRANVRAAIDVLERQRCQCLDARGDFARVRGQRPRKVKVECVRCEVLRELGVDDPQP
jgi:hypothetical protein